ncbi:MAG: DUF4406 domain-containing protein [Endomicrobium sp.]|jgi:hypothetical protein|nr:DUF4406 domain-containing protein [Endomicrobium sp.]
MNKTKKPIVYISGKITGEKYYKRKFADAERKLKAAGYEVLNPARMIKVEKWKRYDDYLKEAFMLLFQADFFYALPCWVDSDGAKAEFAYAIALANKGRMFILDNTKLAA